MHFKASKPIRVVQSIAQSLVPLYFGIFHRGTRLRVTPSTLAVFQELKDKPVIICPNHSHHEDGEVIFWLSAVAHQTFEIMTARELFEHYRGLEGFLLQRLGCYSVSRGVHDTQAVEFTEGLLEQGPRKVVIFPEGEVSHNSDTVSPLQLGAVFTGLEACMQLLHAGKSPDIYILPMAIS